MSNFVPILQEHVRATPFELEELLDRAGTLVLTLSDASDVRIKLKFGAYMAYRKLDEGDALLTLSAMRRSGGTGKVFYRVDDSKFAIWFDAERCNDGRGQPLVHYSVASMNDIVDVLSLEPPIIEIG